MIIRGPLLFPGPTLFRAQLDFWAQLDSNPNLILGPTLILALIPIAGPRLIPGSITFLFIATFVQSVQSKRKSRLCLTLLGLLLGCFSFHSCI